MLSDELSDSVVQPLARCHPFVRSIVSTQRLQDMKHTGASLEGFAVATPPIPMLGNATLLPNAEDQDCGLVLLNSGGTWIGHVGPGLLFLLWGLWWTVNIFLAHLRQSGHALRKPFSCSSYYPSPWIQGRLFGWTRHWEAVTLTWGPLFMVWLELKGDHQAYTWVTQQVRSVKQHL